MKTKQPPPTIGSRIHDARRAHNWTQQDFAEILGVHHITVSRWEHGQTPGIEMLRKIGVVLKMTVGELIG